MRSVLTTFLTAAVGALLCAAPVRAQITGDVRDADTNLPLSGATVRLVEPGRTAMAVADGTFSFPSVRPGRYTVRASYVGYATSQRTVDVDAAGHATPVHFGLDAQELHLAALLAEVDAPVSAASSGAVRAFDLAARPPRSAQDLMRLVPGLVTAQHAGGGKAEQIFLRGFDADHGTDVAVSVDGVPVNLVSHGHGQGYADVHFLIPETVDRLDVRKGPYRVQDGDFATAGAVAFTTKDRLDHALVRVGAGAFHTYDVTALGPLVRTSTTDAYVAAQGYASDGPFEAPQAFRRGNAFARLTHRGPAGTLRLSAGGFGARWNASGQIPARAVAQIGRFGAVDAGEGGRTHRADVRAELDHDGTLLRAYAFQYGFRLFSNFTFFLEDPVRGDMIEQRDERTVAGLEARRAFAGALGRRPGTLTLGTGLRADYADVGLYKSPARVRVATLVDSRVREAAAFAWAEEDLHLAPRLRLVAGLRADAFRFAVDDHLDGTDDGRAHASGTTAAFQLSPKANLVWRPTDGIDVYANAGTGFHSNDARAVVYAARLRRDGAACAADPGCGGGGAPGADEALPRAVGAELGTRLHRGERVSVSAALWRLDLAQEFTYVGDAGTTEPSGRTRRVGLDVEEPPGAPPLARRRRRPEPLARPEPRCSCR